MGRLYCLRQARVQILLSVPSGKHIFVDDRLSRLEQQCADLGVTVEYAPLERLNGLYHHAKKLIVVSLRLTTPARVGTLAHEYVHATLGHDGPQLASVERRVDRLASRMLVSPEDYARAEALCGPHAGAIAKELDLPVWVVQAWQAQASLTWRPFAGGVLCAYKQGAAPARVEFSAGGDLSNTILAGARKTPL